MTAYSENKFNVTWQDPDAAEEETITDAEATADDDSDYSSSSSDSYLNVGLSETRNEGKTVFCPGDDAFLEVLASSEYTLESAIGDIRQDATGVAIAQTEIVNVDKATGIILRHTPVGAPDITWNPPTDAAVTIDGRKITLSKPVFSIATITHDTLADVWALSGIAETSDVRVLASAGTDSSALTVSYQCDAEDPVPGEEDEIGLVAVNCETGDAVSGVRVWANDKFQGATNSNGIISIGMRTIGETVSIRWVYNEFSGETDMVI